MRITLGLLVFCGLQVSALTDAQTVKVNLNLNKVSIKEALESIKSQSDLNFIYNNDLVNDQNEVSIKVSDSNIDEVLQLLLVNNGLDYRMVDNNVIIYPAKASTQSSGFN